MNHVGRNISSWCVHALLWSIVGGKVIIGTEKRCTSKSQKRSMALFHLSNSDATQLSHSSAEYGARWKYIFNSPELSTPTAIYTHTRRGGGLWLLIQRQTTYLVLHKQLWCMTCMYYILPEHDPLQWRSRLLPGWPWRLPWMMRIAIATMKAGPHLQKDIGFVSLGGKELSSFELLRTVWLLLVKTVHPSIWIIHLDKKPRYLQQAVAEPFSYPRPPVQFDPFFPEDPRFIPLIHGH